MGTRGLRHDRNSGQQDVEAFGHRRVRQNCIAKPGVRQAAQHGALHGGDHLSGTGSEHREAEDAIAVLVDQRLHEAARLADAAGTKNRAHRKACDPDRDPAAARFRLIEADPPQLGINVHAVGDQSIASRPRASGQIVAYDPEVVECDVGELRAAGTFAHRPYVTLTVVQNVEFAFRKLEDHLARAWSAAAVCLRGSGLPARPQSARESSTGHKKDGTMNKITQLSLIAAPAPNQIEAKAA
jgi:hypothetical protein